MGDLLHVTVYVLAAAAVTEAVVIGVIWRLLSRSRALVEELQRQPDLLSFGSKAVKTVWQTANLVRKQGFGAAVRVIEPRELAEDIALELRRAADRYADGV